jgi:hypothetical protein
VLGVFVANVGDIKAADTDARISSDNTDAAVPAAGGNETVIDDDRETAGCKPDA